MQDKFKAPRTVEEFKKQAEPVTPVGAESVLNALNKKLEKSTALLKAEIKFFEEVIEYKKTGKLPEGLSDGS